MPPTERADPDGMEVAARALREQLEVEAKNNVRIFASF
jgi:hypothetical protein